MQRPVIHRLSSHVIDLIAAGEVVERPAAALKELVENAIDAGASRIRVALREGGIQRIEVEDNGCGMSQDDLLLAVERHCTSKLPGESLEKIVTLGFRGEALPSIGASARFSLTSRIAGADTAWRIRVDGGVLTPPQPVSGLEGTVAIVEDLFFATPARRKFLKSSRVEGGHSEAIMRRLAVAIPHCALTFVMDERQIFDLPAQELSERVAAVLGETASALTFLDEQRDSLHLSGFIGSPATTRSIASGQLLMVNGRPVSDSLIKTAIRIAYRPLIEPGRHPIVALFLTLPAERVDVNVHPAKIELRFADEALIRAFVIGALQRALGFGAGKRGHSVTLDTSRRGIRYPSPQLLPENVDTGRLLRVASRLPTSRPAVSSAMQETIAKFERSTRPPLPVAPSPPADEPLGAPLTQIFDTYILALSPDDELTIVDQHAAHERLTHERLREAYAKRAVKAQCLLLPLVVDLSDRQASLLLEHRNDLAALGFELEAFGGSSVALRTIPVLLQGADGAAMLKDLAEELEGDTCASPSETDAFEKRIDAVIARLACHGSIRAGRRLHRDEMSALLREMEQNPRANTCSHGRPTWLKIGKAELEKLFGRRR